MSRASILPPNASALMRAVDKAAPDWGTLPATLRGGLYGHPLALAPWLAAEWGLAPFAPYFPDTTALIDAGLPWLRERGTPAAVRRVLGWLGYTHAKVEDDGWWLHIDPGRRVTPAELRPMAHLVRASLPVHVAFYRVHHGLDGRHIRLDNGPPLDAGWLDNDTGVPIDVGPHGDPIHLSQAGGAVTGCQPPAHQALQAGACDWRALAAVRLDQITLDAWALDGAVRSPLTDGTQIRYAAMAPRRARLEAWATPGRIRTTLCAHRLAAPHAAAASCHATAPLALFAEHDRRWDASSWQAGRWAINAETRTTGEP